MYLKKISLILCVLFISASMFTIHSANASGGFEDVSLDHEAYEEINYLVSSGVIKGYTEKGKTYYKPYNNVTRGQVAKMVVIASGNKPLVVKKSNFSDVTVGTELSGYVERAVQLGFFATNTKGKFLPNKLLTRDEMSFILSKAFKLVTTEKMDTPFVDVAITHPYAQYVNTIYFNGITKGSGQNYNPSSQVTRAQFALFVARAKSEKYRLELPVKGVDVPDTLQAIGLIQVTTDGLNIRKSKDTTSSANIVGTVNKGGKLSVYDVEGDWLKVSYKGVYAYIYKSYAQFLDADGNTFGNVQKQVTTTQDVTVYVKPSASSKTISTVKSKVELPVYKTVNGYHLTVVSGLPGYIIATSTEDFEMEQPSIPDTKPDLDTNPNPDPDPDPDPTPPSISGDLLGRVTVDNLNIRKEANSTSAVVGKLRKGDYVQVNSINEYWVQVTFEGQKGYVHKSYLKLLNQSGNPLKDRIIIIDPGHGGKDVGTISGTDYEKTITLKVSTLVKQKLEAAGAKVMMPRTGDTFPSLQDRVDFTNNNYGEIFVSIHVNSAVNTSAQGTETYYSITTGDMYQEDMDLAKYVNDQIVNNLNMKNRGIKEMKYYVIANTIIPAILVELGFLSNSEDRSKLTDDQYIELFAESIYKGISEYYTKQ